MRSISPEKYHGFDEFSLFDVKRKRSESRSCGNFHLMLYVGENEKVFRVHIKTIIGRSISRVARSTLQLRFILQSTLFADSLMWIVNSSRGLQNYWKFPHQNKSRGEKIACKAIAEFEAFINLFRIRSHVKLTAELRHDKNWVSSVRNYVKLNSSTSCSDMLMLKLILFKSRWNWRQVRWTKKCFFQFSSTHIFLLSWMFSIFQTSANRSNRH